jgi:hypothetical protein
VSLAPDQDPVQRERGATERLHQHKVRPQRGRLMQNRMITCECPRHEVRQREQHDRERRADAD